MREEGEAFLPSHRCSPSRFSPSRQHRKEEERRVRSEKGAARVYGSIYAYIVNPGVVFQNVAERSRSRSQHMLC